MHLAPAYDASAAPGVATPFDLGAAADAPTGGPERRSTGESWRRLRAWLREYFACDHRRAVQTGLGLLWLLDGALQFQGFMYSHGFIDVLTDTAAGQPNWIAGPMNWAAHLATPNLGFFNSLFALTQVAIGLGLLYRPFVKRALVLSFGWAMVVWWFGEGFGLLFANTANPLTGAPGAVLLYAIVGLLAWPTERPGGLLGARGAKTAWAVLWLVMAWAWLLGPNSSPDATSAAIRSTPSGVGFIDSVQNAFADAARGIGVPIALVLAAVSAAIGLCVALDIHPRRFLRLALGLSVVYWVVGQGVGQLFTGTATDPNAAPLFALLAFGVWPLAATSTVRRFSFRDAAAGLFRELDLAGGTPGQKLARTGLAAGAVGIAVAVIVVASMTSTRPRLSADALGPLQSPALASLGHLQPPPQPGPTGPEGIPVPSGPPLAAAGSASGNTAVDGIPSCVHQPQIRVRRDDHLMIFVRGFARQIPAGIGLAASHASFTPRGTFFDTGNCFSALHTNAADGMIEIRAPNLHDYTLGDFFDLWGQPLGRDAVGPEKGRVTALVNGKPYVGNPRSISLTDAGQIQLEVGTPLVAPVETRTAQDI